MKKGMDRYATQNRLGQKGYLRKHQNRSQSRKASKTGSCDCIFCSWERQEKEQIDEEQKRECDRDKSENLHGVILALPDVQREQTECQREARTSPENIGDSKTSRVRDVLLDEEFRSFGGLLNQKSKEELEDERSRKENPSETHQERQQRIQESVERRQTVKEANIEIQTREEKMKKKEKVSIKERKHEAKESKAYEKREDKKESKSKNKKS